MSNFYLETAIAKKTGADRDLLATARAGLMKKGDDWVKIGRDIALTETGLKILTGYLGSAGMEIGNDFEDCLIQKKPRAVTLTMVRKFPNTGLILATSPEGKEVRVKVPNSRNFAKGMKLRAIPPDPGAAQVYKLDGRCPRGPGRW